MLVASPHSADCSYRLGLPRPTDSLGLPVGQHVSLAAQIGGKRVIRSYTPTSLDSELGYFDLVVKVGLRVCGGGCVCPVAATEQSV